MNTQEKIFGYFTEEDWLEIKEHLKEVLKKDIENLIEEEYIFDIDYLRSAEKEYLEDATKDAVKELLKENDLELRKIIKEVIREEVKKRGDLKLLFFVVFCTLENKILSFFGIMNISKKRRVINE